MGCYAAQLETNGRIMPQERVSLSRLEVGFLFGALAVLGALNVWQLESALVAPPIESAVEPAPDADMPEAMRFAYDIWQRNASDISVFARGATAYGWVIEYPDEATARRDALAWCAHHGSDCRVVEVRLDIMHDPDTGLPLTKAMKNGFVRFEMTPGPASFATSPNGAFAIGRGATDEAADRAAVGRCLELAAQERPEYMPRHPCTVVARR